MSALLQQFGLTAGFDRVSTSTAGGQTASWASSRLGLTVLIFAMALFSAPLGAQGVDPGAPPTAGPPGGGAPPEGMQPPGPGGPRGGLPGDGNPMGAMAAPTGPGAKGIRTFTRTDFLPGDIAGPALAAMLVLLLPIGWLCLYGGTAAGPRFQKSTETVFSTTVLLTFVWAIYGYMIVCGPNYGSSQINRRDKPSHRPHEIGNAVLPEFQHFALQDLEPRMAADEREYPLRMRNDRMPAILVAFVQFAVFAGACSAIAIWLGGRISPPWVVAVTILWGTLVYMPIARQTLGFGWLLGQGLLDHGAAAVSGVAVGASAAVFDLIVPRRGERTTANSSSDAEAEARADEPAAQIVLGSIIVWMALCAQCLALHTRVGGVWATTLLSIHLSATAGALGWAGSRLVASGTVRGTDLAAGLVAGLFAGAAGSAFIAPQASIMTGLLGGVVTGGIASACNSPHDARSPLWLQGVPSALGLILAGTFATPLMVSQHVTGSEIHGFISTFNLSALRPQFLAVAGAIGWSTLITSLLAGGVRLACMPRAANADGDEV